MMAVRLTQGRRDVIARQRARTLQEQYDGICSIREMKGVIVSRTNHLLVTLKMV